MSVSRSVKRTFAALTAMMFLLCQAAALAQVCVTALPDAHTAAGGAMPCHGAADAESHERAAPSVCDASTALPQTDKAPTFALPTIPILVVAAPDPARVLHGGFAQPREPLCTSPPLTVLHCRFLI